MKYSKYLFFIVFGLFVGAQTSAQPGGNRVYEFLNLPMSAKSASVGGYYINQPKATIQTYADNPAMLDSSLERHLGFTYINYVAGINIGQVNYAWRQKKLGTVAVGMQYINHGKYVQADLNGQKIGEFSTGEYALVMSYARQVASNIRIGMNSKIIFSDLSNRNQSNESAASFGFAFDAGAHYVNDEQTFSSGLVLKNAGFQLVSYAAERRGNLPLLMQWGTAYKVPNAPFRLNLILNNLQTWKLGADDDNINVPIDPLTGEEINTGISLDNILRKGIVAVEVILSENAFLNLGYNHNRRSDLHLAGTTGMPGFNFGLGFIVKKTNINFALARYHRGGASAHLSFGINLAEI